MGMKKIVCCGFHYTGSGVIDDIFRECDNVYQGKYEAEIHVLHSYDGVSDLEYNLVENPHRLNSSLAIKRFIKMCDSTRVTKRIVGPTWMQLVKDYADSLILLEYPGYSACDVLFFNYWQKIQYFFARAEKFVLPKRLRRIQDSNCVPSARMYYSRLEEREFIRKTRDFVNSICQAVNHENKEYVMLDQFIGTNYPSRYIRYIDDVKVFMVDRDPRDVYISRISKNDRVLPKDPHEFCVYYRNIRKMRGDIPADKCILMQFEDLIYKYEESLQKVFEFVGMDRSHHIAPRSHFNPAVSIGGTKLWEKHPEYSAAIKIIEEELSDYLYKY